MKPLNDCHVLVTPTSFPQNTALCKELENQVGRVTYNTTGKPFSSEQLCGLLVDVDGFLAGLDVIDAAALQAGRNLKVVARYGVGVSNVDLETARRLGITVTNTPGANSKAVAELTFALMLNLLRPIQQASLETRQGGWPRFKGLSLEGKTVGLIGLGAIGKEVARRLQGWECRILAYDIHPDQHFSTRHGITITAIDELLAQADLVSLHVPLTPETKGFAGEAFFSRMKTGSYFINTSRGELVDECALLHALQEGRVGGAALDTFDVEPPDPANPLLKHPKVIATPHMGAHTDAATHAMGRRALDDCLAVLQDRPPRYRVV
jgi:D-3-phosphoglycerate dehydrogenase / 2-oxoglutarate reductase